MATKAAIAELTQTPSPDAIREIAEFLSSFVRSGGLEHPRPEDGQADTWVQRMDWWWATNPFCVEGRPRALLLRSPGGAIVGFHGFIPHDYIVRDRIVPGLGTTTFFVAPEFRGQSLPMFLRSERHAGIHHMVDGTPSVEMQRILDRFGYQRVTKQTLYYLFLSHRRWTPRGLVLRMASAVSRRGVARWIPDGHRFRLIVDPAEISSVAVADDDVLRRCVTPQAIRWFCQSGPEARSFVGVCDASGKLFAYVISMNRQARAFKYGRVLEYGSFAPQAVPVAGLLGFLAARPEQGALPSDLDFLVWARLKTETERGFVVHRSRPSAIYYKIPSAFQGVQKHVLASEADVALL